MKDLQIHVQMEKIFRELGLTNSQARVYLCLVNLAYPSTAKAISTFSNIARQDIYNILTELHELSLVETIIGNPALFKAISLREAIAILNERKEEKMHDLLLEAKELLQSSSFMQETIIKHEKYSFVVIPKKERCINKVKKAIDAAQESIHVITPWREATQWLFMLHDTWAKALNRGIDVQWITEKQENSVSLSESIRELIENPNFKRREGLSLPSEVKFAIYDGREALIATLNAQNASESPALWTNNPITLCILKDYFQMKWRQ